MSASAQETGPTQATFAIPGVLSLTLGQGFTYVDDTLTLDSATIAIPAINATGTIKGLTLGPTMRPQGWSSISIAQAQPLVTEAYTVSDATLAVAGPSTGYSGFLAADLDLHPSEALQVSGRFGVAYNGLARSVGLGVSGADVAVQTERLDLALTGVNSGAGTMTIDSAEATIHPTGTRVTVTGLQNGPNGMDWDTLDVSQAPISVGNALTITPLQMRTGGSATGYSRAAVVGVAVNIGDVASAHGELVTVRDNLAQQTQVALQNAGATVTVPGRFTLNVDGVNTGAIGTSVDTVSLAADQAGVSAEINGIAVTPEGQFSFNDMTITTQPQGSGQAAGFEMMVTRTEDGYTMTTTSMFPAGGR